MVTKKHNMKKSLLTILSAALSLSAFAQPTPSAAWATLQNSSFTVSAAGTRFLDAVSANDVWVIGYDGFAYNRNYNWFSVSNNGGSTFTTGNVYSDTSTYQMANLDGIDGTTAWVSAFMKTSQAMGAVHQTTNGGLTWNDMTPAGSFTNAASFVNIVAFVTPSVGIIMGDPVGTDFEIWRTTNGGTSFTKVPGANIPNAQSGEYGTVNIYEKYGANDIWFGTTKNRVFHSNDGGLNWTVSTAITSTLGAAQFVTDIAFSDASNGLMTCYFGPSATTASITLWNTTNGGATWSQIPTISAQMGQNDFAAVKGVPGMYGSCSNGATAAAQYLSYSTDNGVTWTDWGSMNIGYLAIDFVNNTDAWVGTFSSQVVIGTEGLYKFSGMPLGVNNKGGTPPLAVDLYPNPSNGVFTIKMPTAKEGYSITVFDVLGKQVYSHSGKTAGMETLSYDLSHLGKGIYSINITKGSDVSTKKIVIE